MTATTPRTRRQLRDKLHALRQENIDLEHRVSSHEIRVENLNQGNEQLQHDLVNASRALEKAGFLSTFGVTTIGVHGNLRSTHWYQPNEAAEKAARDAEAKTRAETLEAVIDALELRDYGYRADGDYYFPGLSLVDERPGHERLWADIQTALQVRAERKAADERAATEEKVAALVKRHNGGLIDGLTLRDLLSQDSHAWVHHPYVSPFAAGASSHHGAAPAQRDKTREFVGQPPAPDKKKPAKKSEDKK